jgi:DNA repair exonuclease SbcCD ATPase subunit
MFGQEQARKEIFAQNRDTLFASIKRQEAEIDTLYAEEDNLLKQRNKIVDSLELAETKLADRKKTLSVLAANKASVLFATEKVKASIKSMDNSLKVCADGEIECLVCGSALDHTSETSMRDHYQVELSDLSAKLVKVNGIIKDYEKEITKIETNLSASKRTINKLDGDLKINSSSAIACEKTIENSRESLRLAESAFDPTQLDLLTVDIESLSKQKAALNTDLKIITAWKQAMSKNGLRLAYLREEVGTLSAIASKFASSVYNKPTNVEFFINDEKDNPQLDFTVNGKGAGAFSTGERRLLEIAITLSLMTLLKTAGMNLEFLILDEALDGLSTTSKTNVLKIISDLSKDYQVIMISHDEMIKRHPGHIIKVIKDPSTNTSTIEIYQR